MLVVKTHLDKSNIAGMGCFASEPISKGTIIWEINRNFDLVMPHKHVEQFPDVAKSYIQNFAYFNEEEGGYVMCTDNAKYFNHSDNSNCKSIFEKTIAARDIEVGEEITENYFSFDAFAEEKLK